MDPEEIQHIETTLVRHMHTPFIFEISVNPTTIVTYLKYVLERQIPLRCELMFGLRVMYQVNPDCIEELLSLNLRDDYYFDWRTLNYIQQYRDGPLCVLYNLQLYFKTVNNNYVLK
jgi:hypothetical protein